jgi:RNA polymerase sigma-70 factor (ECF subfamily)
LITDRAVLGHNAQVAGAANGASLPGPGCAEPVSRCDALDFDTVYEEHFEFIWRIVRRLGIAESSVEDVVQEVFVVVHRRLSSFEGRSSLRSWLYAIVARVVRNARRTLQRKPGNGAGEYADPEAVPDTRGLSPDQHAAQAEAVRAFYDVLAGMSDAQREVFVLAELEGMTVVEIAAATDVNPNTVYSRLRAGRADFERRARRYADVLRRNSR